MKTKFTLPKRLLSAFLAFSMIFGTLSTVSMAAWTDDSLNLSDTKYMVSGTTSDNMPYLETVLVKEVDDPIAGTDDCYLQEISVDDLDLSANKTFIVGIKAHNFDRFKENSYGVSKISTALVYDKNYLVATNTGNNAFKNRSVALLEKAGSKSFYNKDGLLGSYSLETYKAAQSLAASETSTLSSSNTDLSKSVINISYSPEDETDTNEQLAVIEEGSYVAFYEYKVVTPPAENTYTAAVSLSRSSNIVVALRNTAPTFNKTYTANDGLHRYMALTDAVSLWGEPHTVTYDVTTNGGTKTITGDDTKYQETVTDLGSPTYKNDDGTLIETLLTPPDGKVFKGWYAAAATETAVPSSITENTTLYAHYADGYSATFNLNVSDDVTPKPYFHLDTGEVDSDSNPIYADTTDPKTISVPKATGAETQKNFFESTDTTASRLGTPTRTGYTFDGWYTKADDGSFLDEYTDTKLQSEPTTSQKSLKLYAKWTQDDPDSFDYKLKFDKNGGDNDADPTEVGFGTTDTLESTIGGLPVPPTKAGYKFMGWYKNKSGDGAKLTKSDVLFTYTGLTGSDTEATVYARWDDVDDDGDPNSDAVTVKFVSVDSKYSDASGGLYSEGTINDKYVKFGDPIGYVPGSDEMTLSGKAFGGWWTAPAPAEGVADTGKKVETGTTIDATLVDGLTAGGTVSLYARWSDKVSVKLYPNDGTGTDNFGTPVEYSIYPGEKITDDEDYSSKTYAAPTRANYTLASWNTKSNGSGETVALADITTKTFDAETKLYAQWTADGDPDDHETKTITFNKNLDAAADPNPASVTVNKNDKVYESNIPVITPPPSYTFDGWFDSAAITGTEVTFGTAGHVLTKDENVYAHWTYTGDDAITVEFYKNKDDVSDAFKKYATVTVAPTATGLGDLMPANPTTDGKAFDAWKNNDGDTAFTKTTALANATSSAITIKVYATWKDNVSVKYEKNADNATFTQDPNPVEASPTDVYVDPAAPTRTGYEFIGWNTKQNGSGDYIKASEASVADADKLKYDDLSTYVGDDGNVTLYAQWAWVDSPSPYPPTEAKTGGVMVTFDENVNSASPNQVTTHVKPASYFPKLGDAMGALPNDPVRAPYELKEWNTKPDGSGTKVEATTPITEALGAAKVDPDDADSPYALTLYAIWELSDDYTGDKVTLTFNKNLDGKGAAGDKIEIELAKNDVLGYIPTRATADPDNTKADYRFNGWYKSSGTETSGKVKVDGDAFAANTVIDQDMTFYAKWQLPLIAKIKDTLTIGSGDSAEEITGSEYTGSVIKPKYDIYRVPVDIDPQTLDSSSLDYDDLVLYAGNVDFSEANSPYSATYKLDGTTQDLKDAGEYEVTVGLKDTSDLFIGGGDMLFTDPTQYTVTEAMWIAKVNPDTQRAFKEATITKASITVYESNGTTVVPDSKYTIKYYKWTDSADGEYKNGKIDHNPPTVAELTEVSTLSDIGKYVIFINPTDNNYKIGDVQSTTPEGDGYKAVKLYSESSTPAYDDAEMGKNIVFEIVPKDPSASIVAKPLTVDPTVSPAPSPTVGDPITFKDSTYATDVAFDDAEEPTTTEYYARVAKDTDSIQFTVTPKNDTTVVTVPAPTTGVTITGPNDDGEYTVTVKLTSTGTTTNDVTIKTTAGTGDDAPAIEYKFHFQKLTAPEVELNYGNSPYGEIMRASNIPEADKQTAKDKFDEDNRFVDGYIPTGKSDSQYYSLSAWNGSTDNPDRDDTSLFVFEYEGFTDPGLKTVKNSLGETVDPEDITRTIKVSVLSDKNMKEPVADQTQKTYTTDGKAEHDVFTNTNLTGNADATIQPDVYELTYSFFDTGLQEDYEVKRTVVILPKMGDTTLDDEVSVGDLIPIKNYSANNLQEVDNTVDIKTYNLYIYRVMDTTFDDEVSVGDLIPIKNFSANIAIPTYYTTFTK